VAAGAAAACLANPATADAKIVYTAVNVSLTEDTDYVIRPDGIQVALGLKDSCEDRSCELAGGALEGGGLIQGGTQPGYTPVLVKGQTIGPSESFSQKSPFVVMDLPSSIGPPWYYGNWGGLATTGYFGFKFRIEGQTHYGWGMLVMDNQGFSDDPSVQGTLTGFAYETVADKAISAGDESGAYEPEAGLSMVLGALAVGDAGLPIWRKEDSRVTWPQEAT
jgi:hypothetical protein